MPRGIAKESLPLGPCTSILPPCMATLTPEGSGIGLRPIRDISSYPLNSKITQKLSLPNFTKNFAAHFGFARRAPAHQALGRGHNADAQPANHWTNVRDAQVSARSRTRNAL